MLHRRRPGGCRRHRPLDWRAQLPGAQLHARRDASGRRRTVLPLQLPRTRHCRHCARGLGRARADPTQFDPQSPYYDPKAAPGKPRWLLLDVQALRKTRLVGLAELRAHPALADMRVLQRGNRLSITPVAAREWTAILTDCLGISTTKG